MTPIAPHITAFLRERLPIERGASQNTCDSYAITFQLLFEFAAARLKKMPSQLHLENIGASVVTDFLERLETKRNNSPSTRNARLAAIKSFLRFVQYRVPSALEQIQQLLAIPQKKTETRLVAHLKVDEMQEVLDAPEPTTRAGIRDQAMLHVTHNAGLRVSELVGLRMEDVINVGSGLSLRIRGKGRKERVLPLWKETATPLRAWLAVRGKAKVPEVFLNARGESMSRWGFTYILKKHVKIAAKRNPSLQKKSVSPHVLRHYVGYRTMSSEAGCIHAEPEITGSTGEGTCQSLDIVSSAQQTVEEAE